MKILKILFIVFVQYILCSVNNTILAQTVEYDSIPQVYQLYPRNESDNDSAVVTVKGLVDDIIEYDSVSVEVFRNNNFWKKNVEILVYAAGEANFVINTKIYADLVEFRFEVKFWNDGIAYIDSIADYIVCGDAFLINGQSNAVGHNFTYPTGIPTSEWIRTFGTTERNDTIRVKNDTTWGLGVALYDDNKIKYGQYATGVWALIFANEIVENIGIPVCIINGASGGTKIEDHIRDNINKYRLSTIYGRLLYRTKKAGVQNKIKGIIWWQGESDYGTDPLDYSNDFINLYNAWKEDFSVVEKIYTTQVHHGDGTGSQYAYRIREVQRQFTNQYSDVEIMTVFDLKRLISDELHFPVEGYVRYGLNIYRQIARDFYNLSDVGINPPNIDYAFYATPQKDQIGLHFQTDASDLVVKSDTTINSITYYLKDHFYLDNAAGLVSSVTASSNRIYLQLNNSVEAQDISYLPARVYNENPFGTAPSELIYYRGPYLKNEEGIGALAFSFIEILQDDPLPVQLSSFKANSVNGKVILNWRTESEIENLGFEIFKKPENESEYKMIASYKDNPTLKGKGTVSHSTDYVFVDSDVFEGQTYSYLLQDVNYNGLKTSHGPVQVSVQNTNSPTEYKLYQNYPNPFNLSTTITYTIGCQDLVPRQVELSIFDTLGQRVATLVNAKQPAGNYEVKWDATDFASGTYIYKLQSGFHIKTMKMILMK